MKILVFTLLIVLSWGAPSRAEIRPSFSLEYSAWHATDIVGATEGDSIDGKLRILETWKGDLPVGAEISIPELARFAPADARRVADNIFSPKNPGPQTVTGAKMVLFLTRTTEPKTLWKAASRGEEFSTAVVWMEDQLLYSFVQEINPGPSQLEYLRQSNSDFFMQLQDVLQSQYGLTEATTIADKVGQSWALGVYANSKYYDARKTAFARLSANGAAALPVLRQLIAQSERAPVADQVRPQVFFDVGEAIPALGQAGGASVGPELTAMVRDEIRFWRQAAPTLKVGWWNGAGQSDAPIEPLRRRYSKLLMALYALSKIKDARSRSAVVELRDFWRSRPQLNDPSGLNQMIEASDAVLKALDTPATLPTKR